MPKLSPLTEYWSRAAMMTSPLRPHSEDAVLITPLVPKGPPGELGFTWTLSNSEKPSFMLLPLPLESKGNPPGSVPGSPKWYQAWTLMDAELLSAPISRAVTVRTFLHIDLSLS